MNTFGRHPRNLGCMLAITVSGVAGAANLSPGATAVVNAGSPVETWVLNGATLTVNPGGQTLGIRTTPGSALTLDGATVAGGVQRAIETTGSTSSITNSTLTSTGNIGFSVIRVTGGVPSTASVINSTIAGAGRGLNISGGSTATVVNSQITGTGAVGGSIAGNGLGISMVGGEAILQGSQATGSNRGAGLFSNIASTATPHLLLDGSTLTSGAGSAILVGSLGGPAMNANIEVRNGSSLIAANGTILEVGLPTTPAGSTTAALFTVDNSQLTGNVQVLEGATTDIVMTNGAALTGDLTNISSLDMNAASVTGNIVEPAGSPAVVRLANQSRFSGAMSNVASLSMDNSSMTGSLVNASGSTAIVSLANNASLTGSLTNIGSLTLSDSTLTGDVVQDAQTPAALALTGTSRLLGTINSAQSMAISGASTFEMVNDSNVGALTLNGGGVNLGAGNAAFRTLTASTLAGEGTFSLRTDLAAHLSDLVNVTGTANGNYQLAIRNSGVEPIQGDVAQKVVQTGGGTAGFAVLGGQVDAGAYVYRLEQRGTNWYLVQATTGGGEGGGGGDGGGGDAGDGGGDESGDVGAGGGDGGGEPIISPSARAVIGVFSAAPTVWYGELSTLRSRMGELREGHEQGGLWARTYGNKYNVSAQDQVHYSQTQQGLSIGVDTALPSEGQWLVGVMGGYSNSQLDMRLDSNGRVDSYYLGLYSTWLSRDGYYIDAIIKANQFQNRADVRMSDGTKAKGDYDNYGVGGSVEAGKHIALSDGWFIEPYVQGSALWVEGKDYNLDNGLEANSNNADSILGKLGTHFGRTIPLQSGGFVQPYVKVAAAHEFARDNEVRVNSSTFSDDLSGSRGEIGGGVVAQISQVLQVHADVDYSNGKNIEQPWGVNVGLRYTW